MIGYKPSMSTLFVSAIKKRLNKFSNNHVTILKSWLSNVDFDDNIFNNIDFETFFHNTIENDAPPFQRVILILH